MSEHKFKHFLKINSNPRIEISEPFGFDGSTISIEQEKGKHSRNISIFNENNELELHRMDFERISNLDFKNHLFDEILEQLDLNGWELEVEYILEFEGGSYSTGKIDGLSYEIYKDYIKFNITQNTLLKRIKVNEDVSIDAFNNKDLKDVSIEPCESLGIFLKAKPLTQRSTCGEKSVNNEYLTGTALASFVAIPVSSSIIESGIKSTLIGYDNVYKEFDSTTESIRAFIFANRILYANTNLSNIKVKIKKISFNGSTNYGNATLNLLLRKFDSNGNLIANVQSIILYNSGGAGAFSLNEQDFEVNIASMEQGVSMSIYASTFANLGALLSFNMGFNQYRCEGVEITATSTAISTVLKGIRLKDLLQHQARSINFDLIDNVFTKPEYINNFVFNGRMLANLDNLPFNTKFKELLPSVCDEAFADFQINDDNVVIDKITDFYKDVEIASFEELPALSNVQKPNIDYAIKKIEIGFNKSSDDRTGNGEGTNDDVHTKMEVNYPSENVDGILKIEFRHIRSAQLIEEQRRKGNEVEQKTKALENDENTFILDCIDLPPNTSNTFTQFLNCQVTNSSDVLSVISNGTFNWQNLGMIVGQQINIGSSGFASDLYEVLELTPYLARFKFLNYLPTTDFSGEFSLTFSYVLQGVNYTNRTNEGFTLIEGVNNSNNYSNLLFTLKRILNSWSPILGNSSQYLPNKELKVTEIKVNNKLETKLSTESVSVIDFAPILTNDVIDLRFLTGKMFTYKVFANFSNMLQLAQDVRILRGYVTILTNENIEIKGYINKMEYKIFEQELNLTLYQKK